MKALARDELRYTIFEEIYLRFTEPKARRKAHALMEIALTCYAKKGFDGVSLEMIAREAAITRPLLKYYFESAEELKNTAIKYVRLVFQKFVLAEIEGALTPDEMLEKYVRACFVWVDRFPVHSTVWLAFLLRCVKNKPSRELNTAAVATGEKRIITLLKEGQAAGFFTCAQPERAARAVQVMIAGALVSYVSEDYENADQFRRDTELMCLEIAGSVRSRQTGRAS